jgi:glyoxylate reductase
LLSNNINRDIIESAPNLRIIANYAVGYNNIDVDWATIRDIAILNTPGVLTDATADLTFGLLLCAARRICEGDRIVRSGTWTGWHPEQLLGTQVTGKKLGIIGMGRIGQAVAKRALAFSMHILYNSRQRLPLGIERELGASFCSLPQLLAQSDFVSIHCPLNPDTYHLLNQHNLSQLKPGAILINTARGPIVDEDALVYALQNGVISAAALDVYEHEPQIHPGLLQLPQVVLAPHLGSASTDTRREMAATLVRGILSLLNGHIPHNLVNPEIRLHK